MRARLEGPRREVVVLDPNGLARSLGTSRTLGTDTTLAQAARTGYEYVTGQDWTWRLGVIATAHPDPYRPAPRPDVLPLRESYRQPGTAESALRLLRAEYQLTPFQSRDELTILEDFCERVAAGDRTGLAIVHGAGGAGKTRLALELADRLRAAGWYAGPLRDELPDPASVSWLATVTAPVCVLIDYADARVQETRALLQTLNGRSGPPAVVLLSARSTEGEWLTEILGRQTSSAQAHVIEDIELPDVHPRAHDVYRRTHERLRQDATDPPTLPAPRRGSHWTTLDLVLLGWVAAHGKRELPTTSQDLYDEILEHEQRYWARAYTRITGQPSPDPELLARAGACLCLLTPTKDGAADALRAVEPLHEDARWRHDVARALSTCLDPGAGQRLSIRPDPVGDHHLLATLQRSPALLTRCLPEDVEGERLLEALLVLTRAAHDNATAAAAHTELLLRAQPRRWPAVLAVATALGGPGRDALESVVSSPDCPIPLEELSHELPLHSSGLWRLAVLVDDRRLREASADDQPHRAALLLAVSHRHALAGDRAGALTAIDEAVRIRRKLAQANPAAFLPTLATSLSSLSDQLAESGQKHLANPVWADAIMRQQLVVHRGELRALMASWVARHDQRETALSALAEAASEVGADPGSVAAFAVTRARQTVRSVAMGLDVADAGLPAWAWVPVPDADLAFVQAWGSAGTWPDRETAIRICDGSFPGLTLPQSIETLSFLFPQTPHFDELTSLLDAVAEYGLEPVLSTLREQHELQSVLSAWMTTATWSQSFAYLRDHQEELRAPQVAQLLSQSEEPVAGQHLAILRLLDKLPSDAVLQIVTDPSIAADESLDSLEKGQLDHVMLLITACPEVLHVPGTGPFLLAVLALAHGDADQTDETARLAAHSATPVQHRAHIVRLRKLARSGAQIPHGADAIESLITTLEAHGTNDQPAPGTGEG